MPITAARPEELGDVAEVEVGSAEVLVRVDAHDRVEEAVRERKGVRFGVHGYDEVFDTRLADAGEVGGRVDPEVGRPDPHPELLGQEDRRHRGAAPEVEHPHARLERHDLGERFHQPERVRPHLVREHPLRVVPVRPNVSRVVERVVTGGRHRARHRTGASHCPKVSCYTSLGDQGCSHSVAGQPSTAAISGKAVAPSTASRTMSACPA